MRRVMMMASAVLLGVVAAVGVRGGEVESTKYEWKEVAVAPSADRGGRLVMSGETAWMSDFQLWAMRLNGDGNGAVDEMRGLEEVVIVKEGELRVSVGGESRVIGPRSVVLFMPGELRRLESGDGEDVVYFSMRYKPKGEMDAERGAGAGGTLIADFDEVEFRPHDRGGVRSYWDRATAACADFDMHATTLNEGVQSHPPHTHPSEEIILMIEGEAEEYIDGELHRFTAGDMVFLGSGTSHSVKNVGEGRCSYFAYQWR